MAIKVNVGMISLHIKTCHSHQKLEMVRNVFFARASGGSTALLTPCFGQLT